MCDRYGVEQGVTTVLMSREWDDAAAQVSGKWGWGTLTDKL